MLQPTYKDNKFEYL